MTEGRNLNAVILPAWTVGSIAVVPGGAFPSYAQGYYKRFNAFLPNAIPRAANMIGGLMILESMRASRTVPTRLTS